MIGFGKFGWSGFIAIAFFAMLLPLASAQPQPTGKPAAILVLGDSLSAEYGLRHGTGWVALMEQRLAEAKAPYRVINASISGETTSGGLQRIEGLLKQHTPTIVVVELGGNDALRGLSLDVTQNNLAKIIDRSLKIKAKVLLVGMEVPPNYGAAYTQRFRVMYKTLADQYRVALVPFFLEKFGADLSFFQADRIHPSEKAQPIMLDTLWPVLAPLLRRPAT
jgi:acyl-CoA thioesterase I